MCRKPADNYLLPLWGFSSKDFLHPEPSQWPLLGQRLMEPRVTLSFLCSCCHLQSATITAESTTAPYLGPGEPWAEGATNQLNLVPAFVCV